MAGTVFVIKGIKPQKLQIDKIKKRLLKELEAEGKDHQKELGKTTATWQGDKPKFESLVDTGRNDASVLTGPTGNTKGVQKWNWLDQGTRVRRAVMSSNWRSKTRPGRFRSGRGRGRVLRVGRNINRPGIEARRWSETLQKQRRRPFTRRMIKAMQEAGKDTF